MIKSRCPYEIIFLSCKIRVGKYYDFAVGIFDSVILNRYCQEHVLFLQRNAEHVQSGTVFAVRRLAVFLNFV